MFCTNVYCSFCSGSLKCFIVNWICAFGLVEVLHIQYSVAILLLIGFEIADGAFLIALNGAFL